MRVQAREINDVSPHASGELVLLEVLSQNLRPRLKLGNAGYHQDEQNPRSVSAIYGVIVMASYR